MIPDQESVSNRTIIYSIMNKIFENGQNLDYLYVHFGHFLMVS